MARTKRTVAARKPAEVAFDFIKSNFFRVISVDGAFGGLSPQGRSIHMALFSERRPLPQKTVHQLGEGGTLGDELLDRRESRSAFVREIEVDVVMDLPTALAVRKWLTRKIEEMAGANQFDVDFDADTLTPKSQGQSENGKAGSK